MTHREGLDKTYITSKPTPIAFLFLGPETSEGGKNQDKQILVYGTGSHCANHIFAKIIEKNSPMRIL